MKEIRITLEDEEHAIIKDRKQEAGIRSWRDYILLLTPKK